MDKGTVGTPRQKLKRVATAVSCVGKVALSTETDTNLSIGSILILLSCPHSSTPLEWNEKDVQIFLEERLVSTYVRLRSTVEAPYNTFRECENFDISNHVEELRIAAPYDGQALSVALQTIQGRPLQPHIPMWKAHFVRRLYDDPNQCALFLRFHHCIADGMSIAAAMTRMSDDFRAENMPVQRASFSFFKRVMNLAWVLVGTLLVYVRWMWMALMMSPHPLFRETPVTCDKRLAWKTLDDSLCNVAKVKLYGCNAGSGNTFNDVMCTMLAGGLDRYLDRVGVWPRRYDIGLCLPVNIEEGITDRNSSILNYAGCLPWFQIRDSPVISELGNKIGSMSILLPLGVADAQSRLKIINKRTQTAKQTPEPLVTHWMTKVMSYFPLTVTTMVLNCLASQVSIVVTNVRGPERQLLFEGWRVDEMIGFVPPPKGVKLGLSIASYGGKVAIGVNADAALIPNPWMLVECIEEEVAMHMGNSVITDTGAGCKESV